MHEHVFTGLAFGLARIEGAESPAPTWRLVFVDGQADQNGNVIPGTGTGEMYSFLFDDPSVATLHEQSEGASKVHVVTTPLMVVPKGKR